MLEIKKTDDYNPPLFPCFAYYEYLLRSLYAEINAHHNVVNHNVLRDLRVKVLIMGVVVRVRGAILFLIFGEIKIKRQRVEKKLLTKWTAAFLVI